MDSLDSEQRKESPAFRHRFLGLGRRALCARPYQSRERRFIMKPHDDPHDDNPTLTHPWMHWLRRLRNWAARKAARHGRDVKSQIIRGVSYGVGSGAVSLLVVWWERRH
jgi:hypothetical protein